MANIEVRSVDGLAGSALPYAYAVKAGPWLFLTGHEASTSPRSRRGIFENSMREVPTPLPAAGAALTADFWISAP